MKTVLIKALSAVCCFAVLLSSAVTAFSYDDALPSRYSSDELGYIRPAENQYDSDCCWAFSTLGVLSAYSIKHGIHDFNEADYSEAHLAWFNGKGRPENPDDPMFGDGMDSESPYEEGARLFTSTFALAKGSGIEWESNYPFKRTNSQMGNYFEEARYEHSAGILTEAILLRTTEDVKKAVIEYGAAEAGMYYDEAKLYNTAKRKNVNGEYVVTGNCCYFNTEKTGEGHNIMIIGWDDNYPKSNFKSGNMPKRSGAWLCKSSWGTAWGENGLFWISYENAAFENVMTYACVAGDGYDDIYQYDGYGFNSLIRSKDNKKTVSAANVFTAKNSLTLETVGFYTYQGSNGANCDVKIDIYKNLPSDADDPIFNSPALSFSTAVTNDGYHTAELPNSLAMEQGEKFSVVVTVIAADGAAVVPLEGNPIGTIKYNAEECCSFLSISGSNGEFIDTAEKYGGNVCIKAYTKDYEHGTVSAVNISQRDFTTEKGTSGMLDVTVKPTGRDEIVNWSSSDKKVVTVDNSGNYKAVGVGTAVLTASAGGKRDSVTITVKPKNYSENTVHIVNNPGEKGIDFGDTLCLTAIAAQGENNVYFGWYVNGEKQAERSETFELKNASADVTVTVRLEDSRGNAFVDGSECVISDAEKVKVNSGFFKKIVSFFKNLFKADRRKYN